LKEIVYPCHPERCPWDPEPAKGQRASRRTPRMSPLPCRVREFYPSCFSSYSWKRNDLSRRASRERPETHCEGHILGDASTLCSPRKRNSHVAQQDRLERAWSKLRHHRTVSPCGAGGCGNPLAPGRSNSCQKIGKDFKEAHDLQACAEHGGAHSSVDGLSI
jgi:hypothetical protein